LPSATTVDIGQGTSDFIEVTGSTTIESFGQSAPQGARRYVTFDGAPTIINNPSLLLPTGADIQAVPTASLLAQRVATGWRVLFYQGGTASGTVTSVTCGKGLSGGTFSGDGTCGLVAPVTVDNGGTGAQNFANFGVLYGAGSGPVAATGAGAAGQVLTSNGTGAPPSFQPIPAGKFIGNPDIVVSGASSGAGGNATVTAGSATGGAGGNVSITATPGVGANQNGGNVTISAGAATGGGTPGSITLASPLVLRGSLGGNSGEVLTSTGSSGPPTF
jgi:hypothetical protein